MMNKPPTPFNAPQPVTAAPDPYDNDESQPGPAPSDDGQAFNNFVNNTDFLHKIHNPHFPQKNTGKHVPMWLSPKLAHAVLQQHGHTGHAIPHPYIDTNDLTKGAP